MASLIDLLYEYPVLEGLVTALPFDGLLSLARASSLYRAILHGFPAEEAIKSSKVSVKIRPQLFIGKHNTKLWRRLKSKTVLSCSEPQHTKGSRIKGCRSCSMLVCESCIVKSSYYSPNATMGIRRRYLCGTCWNTGNRHKERRFDEAVDQKFCSYQRRAEAQGFCTCTVRDKWLCTKCTQNQIPKMPEDEVQCAGEDCLTTMRPTNCGGRLCTWCELPLAEKLGREQSRRDYDLKHLSARAHSAIHVEDLHPNNEEGCVFGEDLHPNNDEGYVFGGDSLRLRPTYTSISRNESGMNAKLCQSKELLSSLVLPYYAMKRALKSTVLKKASQMQNKKRLMSGMHTE